MKNAFPHLFSPVSIGPLTLKNRLVRSATYDAKADDQGRPTEAYLDFYRNLALGGAGLIITGLAYPQADGKLPRTIGVNHPDCLSELSRIPEAIHALDNDCKIALQIGHTGRQLPPAIDREPLAPSPIREPSTGRLPRELTTAEVEDFIDNAAASISYAQSAGFDAVQVHAAHGWLISSFLSPHTNHRKDRYGGSLENRARLVIEIIERSQIKTQADFPVFIKMNANDLVKTGIELPDALVLAEMFEKAGYQAFEVSSGMWETTTRDPEELGWKSERIPEARKHIDRVSDEAYHRAYAQAFTQKLTNAKTILVGGLKTPALMEDIIASGDADLVSLSRPLIREADLPRQWKNGRSEKAACISCNKCLGTLREATGLKCIFN